MSVFVIAEAACTWRIGRVEDQHVRYARKSIVAAKAAGADAWKTQWTSDHKQMEARRQVPAGTYEILAWPQTWMPLLARECERLEIEFMCTVFLPADIPAVAPFVKRFKFASLEYQDRAMWKAVEHSQQQVIASVGCMTEQEALSNEDVIAVRDKLLMCTAAYPCPLDKVNLRAMRDLFDGLSDHTGDPLTGACAVAAGAEIIEVHFRLDETRKDNPDYYHSHSPNSLVDYAMNVRKAEVLLGDGKKKIEPGEQSLLPHRVVTP